MIYWQELRSLAFEFYLILFLIIHRKDILLIYKFLFYLPFFKISDQHDWFVRSKNNETEYRDYYVWHDGKADETGQRIPPNNWISVFGGSQWTWVESRQQFYLHQFYPEQPDLNYRNQQVQDAMTAMLKFYIDKGVAGFRLDAVS